MAGVQNHTARQYNLKAGAKDRRVTVRLKPGFNVVDDAHWEAVQKVKYVQNLKAAGLIDFGKATLNDDAELADKGEKAQSKAVRTPKKRADK